MPKDVDSRPKSKHFSGSHILEFKVEQERRSALVLRFQTRQEAMAFRRGFLIATRNELQKFKFACEWMTAGAAYFTQWRFFAMAWDLDLIPQVAYIDP
jgi:hypothetical protein